MEHEIVFQMTCAYCQTTIRMSVMPVPKDVLVCKYCCGLYFVSVDPISMEQLDEGSRARIQAAINEIKHDKWIN